MPPLLPPTLPLLLRPWKQLAVFSCSSDCGSRLAWSENWVSGWSGCCTCERGAVASFIISGT
eukprot:15400819-Alexandrium_andersonii.AAC.1